RVGNPDVGGPGACDHGAMTAPVAPAPAGRPEPRRMQRRRSGRLMAGVAGGVADHLGADVRWVRAAFVALTAVSGAGGVAYGLLAVLATLAGVAVLTVPWWVRLVRDLGEERRERIRESERAEIAAHLHDSVLQTLALIQRQSDSPREVLRLARGQERELRSWLYGPTGYGRASMDEPGKAAGLAEAITTAAAEVEDTYAIDVRPVVVGDHPLDDDLR